MNIKSIINSLNEQEEKEKDKNWFNVANNFVDLIEMYYKDLVTIMSKIYPDAVAEDLKSLVSKAEVIRDAASLFVESFNDREELEEETRADVYSKYNFKKGPKAEAFKQYLRDRGFYFEPSENGPYVHFEVRNADDAVNRRARQIANDLKEVEDNSKEMEKDFRELLKDLVKDESKDYISSNWFIDYIRKGSTDSYKEIVKSRENIVEVLISSDPDDESDNIGEREDYAKEIVRSIEPLFNRHNFVFYWDGADSQDFDGNTVFGVVFYHKLDIDYKKWLDSDEE